MQVRGRPLGDAGRRERGVDAAREREPRVDEDPVEVEDDGVGLHGPEASPGYQYRESCG